jgi:hypothetical protein
MVSPLKEFRPEMPNNLELKFPQNDPLKMK